MDVFRKYEEFGRTYLFDIDFWYIKKVICPQDEEAWEAKYTMDAYHAGNVSYIISIGSTTNLTCLLVYLRYQFTRFLVCASLTTFNMVSLT